MFHSAEALPLLLQNSIDATIWSEILQYGLTYTMQTWSHLYDAIQCEPSDVSGYLIRTSGCLIWHDLTTLVAGQLKPDGTSSIKRRDIALKTLNKCGNLKICELSNP